MCRAGEAAVALPAVVVVVEEALVNHQLRDQARGHTLAVFCLAAARNNISSSSRGAHTFSHHSRCRTLLPASHTVCRAAHKATG